MVRPMPGANMPATTKISDAGVHRSERPAKNGKSNHNTAAVVDNEMNDPVIAFDSHQAAPDENMRDGETQRRLKRKVDFHCDVLLGGNDQHRARNRDACAQNDPAREPLDSTEKNTGPQQAQ